MIFDYLKRLFSPSKSKKKSLPELQAVFPVKSPEQLAAQQPELKAPASVTLSSSDGLALATSFNDFLLGVEEGDRQQPNQAEIFVLSGLETLLRGKIPDSAVPRLPDVAMALLKELASVNVTQEVIMSYITRDPVLASEVLRMSNSALFRDSSREKIVNLDSALVMLGLNNLKAIVSSVLMKRLLAIAPIYFKMFGQHLWQHSLECAHACRALAKVYGRADPNNAYLVGLMHDTGKLAIFNLLIQALAQNLDIQPRGSVFSAIVRDNSHVLSARIAREWALPDYLLTALDEQNGLVALEELSIYGFILSQANTLAEFKVIAEKSVRAQQPFELLLQKYSIPLNLFQEVFPKETALLTKN